jgi:hypothetical protein
MDDSKKPFMIGLIVVCLAVAGVITYLTNRGSDSVSSVRGEVRLMKCRNRDCQHVFEMDMADYISELREHTTGLQTPGLPCPKCGKNSTYAAIKCAKCGTVFEPGAAGGGKPADTCPKCGFSERANRN